MTALKKVAKEDLEEGREYFYKPTMTVFMIECVTLGILSNCNISADIVVMLDEFYGPIELEE